MVVDPISRGLGEWSYVGCPTRLPARDVRVSGLRSRKTGAKASNYSSLGNREAQPHRLVIDVAVHSEAI